MSIAPQVVSVGYMPSRRRVEPLPVVQPKWEALGKFLISRRKELSKEMGQDLSNPMQLRATTNRLPANWNNHQTLYTLEEGRPLSMKTLLYLPELYRVGLQEIFSVLLPDYMDAYSRVADRLTALPWLEPIMEGISNQPEPVVRVLERGFTESSVTAREAV